MTTPQFEALLSTVCEKLQNEALTEKFSTSEQFEMRTRLLVHEALNPEEPFEAHAHPQAFPDIAVVPFGIEVKFTTNDTWRSVANSVLETNRVDGVDKIYVVFGKMGGTPAVRWGEYEKCVMHVRTSHVPRFELDLDAEESLFEKIEVPYGEFHVLPMEEKMRHIRSYARARLKEGERLWWLEDSPEPEHSLPMQARLYTKLSTEEKKRLRAEAALLCPGIVQSRNVRDKYDDVALYLFTYHGVVCHQARDLFSAGSVANPENDDEGGVYIERALKLIESEMLAAAQDMEDALFVEYWGESVEPEQRIAFWLGKADALATDWTPSESLFLKR